MRLTPILVLVGALFADLAASEPGFDVVASAITPEW